jgi:membrane fusion protein (multidrug efflux system)
VNGFGDKEFSGEITSIDSLVDQATRNIAIEATVQNEDEKLRPGMFVKVEVLLPEVEGVISVPSTAINYSPYGDSVFLVKDKKDKNGAVEKNEDGTVKKIVKEIFVKTGSTRGDQVAIVSGLKEGDEIASSGVFKLKGDTEVMINNKVQPANEENPKPPDT